MWQQIAGWMAWFYTFGMAENDTPDPDEPDNADDPDPDDPDNQDPDAASEDGEEGDAGAGVDTRQANIKALRLKERAEREARIAAEARLQALQEQIARMNNGGNQPPREAELPADADEMQRFVHQSNKVLKSNTQKIDQATVLALDAADSVKFYSQASKNPLVLQWGDKVEQELERMQREERNRAPRSLIMRYLIGKAAEDAAIAKAKNPGRKSKDQQDAETRTREARQSGSPPRSDVKSGERKSDRQKRLDRLSSQNI